MEATRLDRIAHQQREGNVVKKNWYFLSLLPFMWGPIHISSTSLSLLLPSLLPMQMYSAELTYEQRKELRMKMRNSECVYACVCMCVCMYVYMCVCVCVCVCVSVCLSVYLRTGTHRVILLLIAICNYIQNTGIACDITPCMCVLQSYS